MDKISYTISSTLATHSGHLQVSRVRSFDFKISKRNVLILKSRLNQKCQNVTNRDQSRTKKNGKGRHSAIQQIFLRHLLFIECSSPGFGGQIERGGGRGIRLALAMIPGLLDLQQNPPVPQPLPLETEFSLCSPTSIL